MTNLEYKKIAEKFVADPPYKHGELASRNWGNEWHSLCSYQGKLKPAIAHSLILTFTKENDVVLDPLCGVGTIPFEACLNGRVGIGNDLSELAFSVTNSKLNKPEYSDVISELNKLDCYIKQNKKEVSKYEEIEYYDWGFNGKLADYYQIDTFQEIVLARRYFKSHYNENKDNSAFSLLLSAVLHILHGNRPYALSRHSHPLTPYFPKGEFEYKNLIIHAKQKIDKTYKKASFDNYKKGEAFNLDYNDLPKVINGVDWIITSPPFADSIRFYINNWLRLWFVGWEPEDFKQADSLFLEGKQKKDMRVYKSFFLMAYSVLKPKGRMILHLGKTKKVDMAKELSEICADYFDVDYLGEENVSDIEKHGIKDKGGTYVHQFLFLIKK